VERVYGDLKDPSSLRDAVRSVDTLYHLAAVARHDANVPDREYQAVNVDGTRHVLDAARAAGVGRVLYTGTIEAVGTSRDGSPLTEEMPQHPRNIYGRSKLEAENLVRHYWVQHGMKTVVVRPPMTYGGRELILLQRLFRIVGKGVYPLIGSGTALTEFCYVKNQVQGIRLAAERGAPGEVYFISDERSYSIAEIVGTIAKQMGTRVWTPHLPIAIAFGLGLVFEALSRILPFYPFRIPQTGRPPFSRRTVEWTSSSRLYVDISKARSELGYQPRYTLETGVAETVSWYREQGYLPQRPSGRPM
jgi:UDP-glucose 4-epimerase